MYTTTKMGNKNFYNKNKRKNINNKKRHNSNNNNKYNNNHADNVEVSRGSNFQEKEERFNEIF